MVVVGVVVRVMGVEVDGRFKNAFYHQKPFQGRNCFYYKCSPYHVTYCGDLAETLNPPDRAGMRGRDRCGSRRVSGSTSQRHASDGTSGLL